MFGPGEYRPDPSAGLTAPADLPQPEIVPYSRNDIRQPCPHCGHAAYRDKQSHRTLHDLGNLDVWCPRDLLVTSSQHYCTKCRRYFSADLSDLAPPGSQYTHRVIALAVRIVVEDGLPYRPASWHLWRAALDINSFTPVRMLADCVGTTEVLQYERDVSHGCSVSFASTPHTRWLNCNSSDTVGLTPHICKGNHDEPCTVPLVRRFTHGR